MKYCTNLDKGDYGGTQKDYLWHSSDSSVVSVNAMGVVHAGRPGKAVIKVVAIVDLLNYDEVQLREWLCLLNAGKHV